MIKENIFAPRMLVVAVLAGLSLSTLVRIVFLMAQTAVSRRLSVKHRLDVTGYALDTGVSTAEDTIRVDVVIEG